VKKLLHALIVTSAFGFYANGATIKLWDFNSLIFDGSPGVGTLRPANGVDYPAESIGGVANSFGQVSVVSGSSDPNTLDNSHWRLGAVANQGGFPTATNANKSAGARFRANTSGYSNIHISWDQENSATASRYWRIQYTTNAVDYLDTTNLIAANPIGNPNPDTDTPTWQLTLTADFSALPGVNNNSNFGFRFVSEFESTATGAGTNAYIANRTNSAYGVNGTLWFDMVTVMGDDLNAANQWPVVSAIDDLIILTNQSTGPLDFTVSDAETAADSLILSAYSSNPALVSNITFGGSAGSRTVTAMPNAGQIGTAVICVRVQDGGGKMSESCFRLTVTASPTISRIFPLTTSWDIPITNIFAVNNLPGDPTTWQVTATSANQSLVSNVNISITGTDTNRTMVITPNTNAMGDTTITIVATNSGYSATTNFLLRLAPKFVLEWNLIVVTSNTAVTTLAPTFVAAGLSASDLGRGTGIAAAGLTSGFSANRWNNPTSAYMPSTPSRANALTRGDYYQFSITVPAGQSLSLASLDSSLRRSAVNAALNFEWQYSLDGFATAGVTILPRGPVWSVLGQTNNSTFQYQGRTSGSAPASVEQYDWIVKDVPGRPDTTTTPGDAIPPIDLSTISDLQSVNGPATVTFRLYGWGNTSTADSNTTGLGRVDGPRLRGTIGGGKPALGIALAGSSVSISWSTNAAGYSLQQTGSLVPSNWQAMGQTPVIVGDKYVVNISPAVGNQYYRLIK
jgi:hypothetical protein